MNEIIKRETNSIETQNERAALNLETLLKSRSANSRAQFSSTWNMYTEWAKSMGYDAWELDPLQINFFFEANPARPSTQRARLSQLRTILGLRASTATGAEGQVLQYRYGMLKLFKLSDDVDSPIYADVRNRKAPHALHAEEIYKELNREWGTTELTIRNRAIIAILFYAGLRRSEVCKLKWADVNWQDKTIAIRASKKRKADDVDYVPLLSQVERRLQMWFDLTQGRIYTFCRVGKSGKLLADAPMSGESIRNICGDEFSPHDGRRTLGTRSIEAGTPTNYTQKILRHKTAAMTMDYAKYIESQQLGDKLKLGY